MQEEQNTVICTEIVPRYFEGENSQGEYHVLKFRSKEMYHFKTKNGVYNDFRKATAPIHSVKHLAKDVLESMFAGKEFPGRITIEDCEPYEMAGKQFKQRYIVILGNQGNTLRTVAEPTEQVGENASKADKKAAKAAAKLAEANK